MDDDRYYKYSLRAAFAAAVTGIIGVCAMPIVAVVAPTLAPVDFALTGAAVCAEAVIIMAGLSRS